MTPSLFILASNTERNCTLAVVLRFLLCFLFLCLLYNYLCYVDWYYNWCLHSCSIGISFLHLLSEVRSSTEIFPPCISYVIQLLHWSYQYQIVYAFTSDWFSIIEDIRVNSAKVAFLHILQFFQIIVIVVELQYGSIDWFQTFKNICWFIDNASKA